MIHHDFVTAVAIGAIVGRTAIASTQSFVTGGVASLTLIVVHRLASVLRFPPCWAKFLITGCGCSSTTARSCTASCAAAV